MSSLNEIIVKGHANIATTMGPRNVRGTTKRK